MHISSRAVPVVNGCVFNAVPDIYLYERMVRPTYPAQYHNDVVMKTLSNRCPDVKPIILINLTAKLYSCALTFLEVVRQQIRGEVVVLIPASSSVYI